MIKKREIAFVRCEIQLRLCIKLLAPIIEDDLYRMLLFELQTLYSWHFVTAAGI